MARVALGQLEEALRNPATFRRKMEADAERSFGETYIGILRHAIFRYHKTRDRSDALAYLQQRFDNSARLHNSLREFDTIGQLDWYIDDYESRGWAVVQVGLRLEIPIRGVQGDFKCTGEVMRVDLVPTAGFAAWILANQIDADWIRQLRFPLIQATVAKEILDLPADAVQVGIYDPSNRRVELHTYSARELASARRRLAQLSRDLGF